MDAIPILSAWLLGGSENGTIPEDLGDLGIGDTSKGGGCKDYFNMDCSKAPLSAQAAAMVACFFVSFRL